MAQSFWILLATLLTVATYAFVKLAPDDIWWGDILFVRSVFLFGALLLISCSRGVPLRTKHLPLHLLRALTGISVLTINIVSAQNLPIATSQTLAYAAPLFVALASVFLAWRDGRMLSKPLLCAIAAGFAGVCLTLRPSFEADMALFGLLALAGAALSGGSALVLKALGDRGEPTTRTTFFFGLACVLASTVLWALQSRTPIWELLAVPELLAVGLCTVGSQLSQTQGWGRGKTLLCASLQFSAIPISAAFAVLVFDDVLDAATLAGMSVILGSEMFAARQTMLESSRNAPQAGSSRSR